MIRTLHKLNEKAEPQEDDMTTTEGGEDRYEKEAKEAREEAEEWSKKIRYLLLSFGCSSLVLLLGYFVPITGNMPVMTWVGLPALTTFCWTITPSLSYVGQGMIMGPKTGLSMMLGALFGWGILGPIATHKGIWFFFNF